MTAKTHLAKRRPNAPKKGANRRGHDSLEGIEPQGDPTLSGPPGSDLDGAKVGDSDRVVVLDETMGIADARSLYERLMSCGGETVALDGARVEMIDTAVLQTLAAFVQEVSKRGGAVQWNGVSETVYEAAALLDLSDALALQASPGEG